MEILYKVISLCIVMLIIGAHICMALDDITCTGSATSTFSPGLSFTTQTVTASSIITFNICTSTSDPNITNGVKPLSSGSVDRSCSDLTRYRENLTLTINWNTGATSNLLLNVVSSLVLTTLVSTSQGSVVSGKFANSTVTLTVNYNSLDILNCLFPPPGLTELSGPAILTITKV